jgi:hypothetical protein
VAAFVLITGWAVLAVPVQAALSHTEQAVLTRELLPILSET